jgi:hypothetical protein
VFAGAIDIDSGWSTGYNNFVVNTKTFPNMAALVSNLHSQGINTILWATGMVDTDSPNYAEGLAAGYYLRNFLNTTGVVSWWCVVHRHRKCLSSKARVVIGMETAPSLITATQRRKHGGKSRWTTLSILESTVCIIIVFI